MPKDVRSFIAATDFDVLTTALEKYFVNSKFSTCSDILLLETVASSPFEVLLTRIEMSSYIWRSQRTQTKFLGQDKLTLAV